MAKKHRQVRSFWANGKRFLVALRKNLRNEGEQLWGRIDYDEGNKVWIDSQAAEETLLDTRIHEFTHAFFDAGSRRLLHEDTVDLFATDLMRFLWRCGYRCPGDDEWGD